MRKRFLLRIILVLVIIVCTIAIITYWVLQVQRSNARSIAELTINTERKTVQEGTITECFFGIELPASDANINDIITHEYSDRQLEHIRKLISYVLTYQDMGEYIVPILERAPDGYEYTAWNIQQLNANFPIECIRKEELDDGELRYAVYYRSTSWLLELEFLEDGSFVHAEFYDVRNKSEFDNICVGDRFEDVKSIDPGGNYTYYHNYYYLVVSPPPRTSSHYLAEGYMLEIKYYSAVATLEPNAKIIDFKLSFV